MIINYIARELMQIPTFATTYALLCALSEAKVQRGSTNEVRRKSGGGGLYFIISFFKTSIFSLMFLEFESNHEPTAKPTYLLCFLSISFSKFLILLGLMPPLIKFSLFNIKKF